MNKLLKELYSSDNFRKNGHEIVDLLADYLDKALTGNEIQVMNWKDPEKQFAFWDDYQNHEKSLADLFKDVIGQSIHIHHPKYVGHQVSPPAPDTSLAAMVSALLNNGMAIYEMGPVASAMEQWVTNQFSKYLGLKETASGFLTSGGTLATLTALLAARQIQSERKVWEEGLTEKFCILVPEHSHYCIDRAARIMGFGADGIVKIPVNDQFQVRVDIIEESYNKALQNKRKVIAVVANACSTATGTYDDLSAIGDFCENHNLWFHIDAAHGGGAIFSKKYKHLLKGVEKADSVIIDLHKMLMNPALSTLVMFKNGKHSYETFNQKAQYLWAKEDEEWFNYAKRTLECTKLMMSLKFYTLVHQYGFKIFDENVTSLYDLARSFAEQINKRQQFDLVTEPMANIVCFRLVDRKEESFSNNLNRKIRQQILEEGEFYIVQTEINNKVYLRTTLMNPFTTEKHLEKLLDKIESLAEKISANN